MLRTGTTMQRWIGNARLWLMLAAVAAVVILIIRPSALLTKAAVGATTQAATPDDESGDPVMAFQRAYAAASDPVTRRRLVIDAIDTGAIRRGMAPLEAKRLFGNALLIMGHDKDKGMDLLTVFFEPARPQSDPLMGTTQKGWYIDLWFHEGKLEQYYLTNLHK